MTDLHDLALRPLLEHAHLGVVIHRWDTTIVYANPAALRLLRLSYAQMIGRDALDAQWNFIDERNRRLHLDDFPVNKVKQLGMPLRNEIIGVVDSTNPEISWFSVNAYTEGDGADGFIVVIFNDITHDKTQFSFRDIVEYASDVVIVTEAKDIDSPSGPKIVYVNKAFETLTGYSAKEALGDTPRLLQGSLTSAEAKARIRQALERREPVREKLLNYGKEGVPYWLDLNIFPLRNRFGEVTHFAAIERNVSEEIFKSEQLERKNMELRQFKENLQKLVAQRTQELRDANLNLERLAYYDALTQIPNRRSFIDQAEMQVARAQRTGRRVLMGMVDVDHFKRINDQFGHDAGDRVLIQMAAKFAAFFRRDDCFGRLGGEEFAFCILLDEEAQAAALCERIRQAVELAEPVAGVQGVTVSVGGAVDRGPSLNATALLSQADRALYQAKDAGRNRVALLEAEAT